MDELGETVVAHDATLTQMHARLGRIEACLTRIEARLDATANRAVVLTVGGGLGALMTLYQWW